MTREELRAKLDTLPRATADLVRRYLDDEGARAHWRRVRELESTCPPDMHVGYLPYDQHGAHVLGHVKRRTP